MTATIATFLAFPFEMRGRYGAYQGDFVEGTAERVAAEPDKMSLLRALF